MPSGEKVSHLDIDSLIAQLTLEEKAALCSGNGLWKLKGIPRLGIPPISVADGPHGLRKQKANTGGHTFRDNVPATSFPTASALASTWNRDLISEVGKAIGEEARHNQVNILLGPGVNIKRSPLGGRNFEYFSEDPFLSGSIASAFINGVQSTGVGTSIKHFAANNQETRRFTIDAQIDDRALREIYLRPFEIAVKEAKPWTVMAAYNKVNGAYCTQSKALLKDILRDQWNFKGLVMSDWGAVSDRTSGLLAGMDLEMPGYEGDGEQALITAIHDGTIPMAALDLSVRRILALIFNAAEAFSEPADGHFHDMHHELATKAACEGAVLLKNDHGCLPLVETARVALIGSFAKEPRYQGAGSSMVTPVRMTNAYDEIKNRAAGQKIEYAPGYNATDGSATKASIIEAARAAAMADVAVVFAGLPASYETEGLDRKHMRLPSGQNSLIEAVCDANPNVAVVLMNGSPVEMPWKERGSSILEAYLGGQAGGVAISRILFGDYNPSGKLAETFPLKLEDNPANGNFPGGPATVEYRESIYVGYRYYDKAQKNVLFPFGHGLSFTEFLYEGLTLSPGGLAIGGSLSVRARLTVTNIGTRPGAEVIQLYVKDVESTAFRPKKELKDFAKLMLEPNEKREVEFVLGSEAFSYWDKATNAWKVEPGGFEILLGSSSRDIRLSATLEILPGAGAAALEGALQGICAEPAEYGGTLGENAFSREAFGSILGHDLPINEITMRGSYTPDTPLSDIRGFFASLFRSVLVFAAWIATRKDAGNPTAKSATTILKEMPLRSLPSITNGAISGRLLKSILRLINGGQKPKPANKA